MRNQWLNDVADAAVKLALGGALALLLAACGGGGVSGSTPLTVGSLALVPGTGTLYAGLPYNFTVAGGTKPYLIVSDQQQVLDLNMTLDGHSFTVVPGNPGVIDAGLQPTDLPVRTVNVTVRDSTGTSVTNAYKIAVNYATGYDISLSSLSLCGVTSTTVTSVDACAGFESLVQIRSTIGGATQARRVLTVSNLLGDFGFFQDAARTIVGPSVTITTDDHGNGTAHLYAFPTAFTQFAALRLTDVQTGGYRDVNFVLLGAPISALAVLPTTISVTGADSAHCGTGVISVIVTGGLPPYTATSTLPSSIVVTPNTIPTVLTNGGSFTISISGAGFSPISSSCPIGSVLVTDSAGQTATVTVTSIAGTGAPAQALAVAPSSLCIADSSTGNIIISGGNSNKVLNSSNTTLLTVSPASGTGTFTDTLTAAGAGGGAGTPVTVTVSDGAANATVAVTRKTTCP